MKEHLCLCIEVSVYIGLSFINFFFCASLPITVHHHVCYSPKTVRIKTSKPNTTEQRKGHRQEMSRNVEL